jgi:hypothetical protein
VVRLENLVAQVHEQAALSVAHDVEVGAARLTAWMKRRRTRRQADLGGVWGAAYLPDSSAATPQVIDLSGEHPGSGADLELELTTIGSVSGGRDDR